MNSAKLGAIATTALTLMYVLLLGNTAVQLLSSGKPVGQAMGVLLLIFPVLAIWLIIAELRFGTRVEKLGKTLEDAGLWPHFDFDLRPSGRVIRSSCEPEFEKWRTKTEKFPQDWQNWFALGLVYDAAGDLRRARASMRKAIELANNL